jgi:hypothetical protein
MGWGFFRKQWPVALRASAVVYAKTQIVRQTIASWT